MKQSLVQTIIQGEHTLGQVSDPNDLMKAQQFLHDRLSAAVNDFVNRERTYEISGFAYELGAGNAFDITLSRPGRVYTRNGISYDLLADATLAFEPADDEHPRFDLVVARLDDEVQAELDLIPFVQLRTPDEFTDEVPAYPPQNISSPTELHWRAVPLIKKGTPAEIPALPPVDSNEIPLYLVAVGSGVTQLNDGDILDLRELVMTLRQLNDLARSSKIDIANLLRRVSLLEDSGGQPIDLSKVFGEIKSLRDILAELERRTRSSNDLPDIRYERPKEPLTENATSMIVATGNTQGSTPVVDIEIGGAVNFGDAEVKIEPRNFDDQSVNPRYHTVSGSPAEHLRRTVDLTIDSVTPIGTSGIVDFVERSALISPARSYAAAAARDNRYVEIFGGLSADNSTPLGDWHTYDTVNDTLTPRSPSSSLPNAGRPAMIPYGDGNNVLLIAGDQSTQTPQCFRINASDGTVTEIATTKPTGIQFFGDLIAAGKMFIVAIKKVSDQYETDFWEYDTATHQFTQLGVTGSVPTPHADFAGGCYYRENQFVMVTFQPGVSGSGQTFVFDRTSLQWIELQIGQPYLANASKQLPISGFRMAHVNGRPVLVGGDLTKDTDDALAKVWELINTPQTQLLLRPHVSLSWISSDATFPRMRDSGFCASIGTSGLPDSKAFLFGGFGFVRKALNRIYVSTQAGLIAVDHLGLPGVSIAPGSKSVSFEVEPFTADWEIAAYLANFDGRFDPSQVFIEVSFDAGSNWHPLKPGVTLGVTDSSDPGERRMRITLFNSLTSPPILTRLQEALDSDGGELEDRVVIRYNAKSGDDPWALYIDRQGKVTLSQTIEPSTPLKALIHKVSGWELMSPPTVKNYINRRRPHIKYTGTKTGDASSTRFDNELAVPVRFRDAYAIKDADGSLYSLDSPDIEFDEVVDVNGVASNNDRWVVEIDG